MIRRCAVWGLVLLGGCVRDIELPPLVASSEYIDFHTDADAAVVCLDDLLAREDRFIERTAATLGVEAPRDRIDFVWDPNRDADDPWVCPETAACYRAREGDDLSLVVSDTLSHHHELVHAVEIQALGGDAHRVLGEGLADYLGSLNPSPAFTDFAGQFEAMLAAGPELESYRVAMHFVGSLIARDGVEKYRALRERMPRDAGVEEFAAVYEAVLGRPLDAGLAAMNGPIFAIDEFSGCEDAPVIAWDEPGLIDTRIEAACGDPWFHGGGFEGTAAGFYGFYIVEVPAPGLYALTVVPEGDGWGWLLSGLTACSFDIHGSAVGSRGGQPGTHLLQAGRHRLAISYPQRDEARGAAKVRLEYLGEPETGEEDGGSE